MTHHEEQYPDTHHDPYSKTIFGFWLYLLTDLLLFAPIFAAYEVLKNKTFGGPAIQTLMNLPVELAQSLILITCSLTSGIAAAFAHRKNKKWTVIFFLLTALLGTGFIFNEIGEFYRFANSGHHFGSTAFLSTYFSLIGTFDIHIIFAILWTLIFLVLLFRDNEVTKTTLRRLTCLKMFWQYLNIVWIFIFTLVYLLGGR